MNMESDLDKCVWDFQKKTDFNILEYMGEGGYGIVLKVEEPSTNLIKAAKIVSQTTIGEDFYWPQLNHPSIMELHDTIALSPYSCAYIMPCFEDDLYNSIICQDFYFSPMSFDRKKRYMWQILNGLFYLHSSKMCHFNLKLENVMICLNSDTAVIGDFSTLKRIHKHGDYFFALKRCYHPPEIISRQHRRSCNRWNPYLAEMWTFGILTLEAFTIHAIDRHMQFLDNFDKDVYPFLICLKDGRNIEATLRKSHPAYQISPADVAELISFLDQFLLLNPQKRVSADMAMMHMFLRLSTSAYSNPMLSSSSCSSFHTFAEDDCRVLSNVWRSTNSDSNTRSNSTQDCRDLPTVHFSNASDDSFFDLYSHGRNTEHCPHEKIKRTHIRNSTDEFPKLDYCFKCCRWWAREVSHECDQFLKSSKRSRDVRKKIKRICFPCLLRCRRGSDGSSYESTKINSFRRKGKSEPHNPEDKNTSSDIHIVSISFLGMEKIIGCNELSLNDDTVPKLSADSVNDLKTSLDIVTPGADNETKEPSTKVDVHEEEQPILNFQLLLSNKSSPSCANEVLKYLESTFVNLKDKNNGERKFPKKRCISKTGSCYIRGKCYCNESEQTLALQKQLQCPGKHSGDHCSTVDDDDGQRHATLEQISDGRKQVAFEFPDNLCVTENLNCLLCFPDGNLRNWMNPRENSVCRKLKSTDRNLIQPRRRSI